MEEQGLNPKASTVIPVTESNAGPDARFHVWIFHNAPIKSKPLAMDM